MRDKTDSFVTGSSHWYLRLDAHSFALILPSSLPLRPTHEMAGLNDRLSGTWLIVCITIVNAGKMTGVIAVNARLRLEQPRCHGSVTIR